MTIPEFANWKGNERLRINTEKSNPTNINQPSYIPSLTKVKDPSTRAERSE